ncbi:MAG: site-specific DNA-methyltransferase [Prevotellaceae bacterium]|jgi:site-specific DNA-methyltransferase (adenine-specific)|nr:site-specific DNA-methyltransferase [Prevotellaceae bacterium]
MVETQHSVENFCFNRLPKGLQESLGSIYYAGKQVLDPLAENAIYVGDARDLLKQVAPNSIAVSVWSPPYFVGKSYEKHLSFDDWKNLLETVVANHFPIIKPGGFLVINIADILVFRDENMPKVQADAVQRKKVSLHREDILQVLSEKPHWKKDDLAQHFRCSEQTIDRRLNGNNARGGKYGTQSRVKIVGGLVEKWALKAGFYPYDRRIWVKDAAWENSRWTSLSYRAVDEFEYIYIFWKPGVTTYDRGRLSDTEWKTWGARGVWSFPSVRANDDHEAKFPIELPLRVIKLLSNKGDTVLDCFIGSGTTAIAALRMGRKYIGMELKPEYANLAKGNIRKVLNINVQNSIFDAA